MSHSEADLKNTKKEEGSTGLNVPEAKAATTSHNKRQTFEALPYSKKIKWLVETKGLGLESEKCMDLACEIITDAVELFQQYSKQKTNEKYNDLIYGDLGAPLQEEDEETKRLKSTLLLKAMYNLETSNQRRKGERERG